MNEAECNLDSLEADNVYIKKEVLMKTESNDWEELGLEFDNGSQTNESSTTPKPRSNLDEVIDSVIQDALDYADAPPEKRILPPLVRKSTKSRSRQSNSSNSNTGSNNSGNFPTVPNHQMATSNHTTNAIMNQNAGSNNSNNNSIHPLMQGNFAHPNMQQMAAQLQLAASGKGIVSGTNNNSNLMQHNMIGSGNTATNNQSQHQQQLTAAMMGFGASQIPNMMMPTYNGNVPITYHQQMTSGQYHLPVTFAQIQQLHQQQQQQQQQQQSQQHQQTTQSHLLLGQNPNSSDLTAGNAPQQNNMNFATGATTNPTQTMLPTSYANFSNQAIAVAPYQIPGMMHAFASPTGSTNSSGTQLMSTNPVSTNLNGPGSTVTNSRYHSSTNSVSNQTSSNNTNIVNSNVNSNSTNPSNPNNNVVNAISNNNSNIALTSNNSNQNANANGSVNLGASPITAASMASLYQQLPPNAISNNPFDLHQQQMLYNQRILQAQQQTQQQSNSNAAGILSEYAVSRYSGGYH